MYKRDLAAVLVIVSLSVLAVMVLGNIYLPYHGLPLGVFEFAVFAAWLMAVLVFPWRKKKAAAWAVGGALVIFTFIEVGSYFLYPAGWSVCVRRVYEPETLVTACEPTAQDRSGEEGVKYRNINFDGTNMPLYFMNERVFHYHAEGSPDRHDMPYEFLTESYFNPGERVELLAKVNMEGVVLHVDDEEIELREDEAAWIKLPENGITKVSLYYQGHRQDSDLIHISTDAIPFTSRPGAASWQGGLALVNSLAYLSLVIPALVGLWSLANYFLGMGSQGKKAVFFGAAAAAAYFFVDKQIPELLALVLVIIGLAAAGAGVDRKRAGMIMVLILLALSIRQVSLEMDFDELVLLPGGDDMLTHEGLARSVMKSRSWGEFFGAESQSVYYFQPLHRYIFGLEHRLLGEPLAGPIVIQVWLMGIAVMAAIAAVSIAGGSGAATLFGLLFFVGMAGGDNNWLSLSMMPHQEALAFPLFMLGIAGIILLVTGKLRTNWEVFCLGLIWGLAVGIRTNLGPASMGLGLIAAAWIYRRKFMKAAALTVGYFIPLSVIMTRNYFVAGQPKLFTNSIIPNVINDLRGYIPGPEGPSDFGFRQVVSILWTEFEGRHSELAGLLWQNAFTHYVGQELMWQILWSLFIVVAVGGILAAGKRIKILMAILLIIVVMPMLFSSLFLHRAVAVRTQGNVVLALVFSLAFVLALKELRRIFQAARNRMAAKVKRIR